jgi:hypothetical protein
MLLQEVATVVLAIRASGCEAEEASDGGGEILGASQVGVRKLGEEPAYKPRNARVVTARVPARAFDHGGIDGDVQALLGHQTSCAHDLTTMIRILGRRGKNGAFRGYVAGRAEVGCGDRYRGNGKCGISAYVLGPVRSLGTL